MTRFAFLDTETTGLDPQRHELLEVAVVLRGATAGRDCELHFALNIDPACADEGALRVNRYWERRDELAQRTIPEAEARASLNAWLDGAVVVGNNPQFDLRFIEHFLGSTPWNYHPLDIKSLVGGARPELGLPPWSTGQVARAAGVPIPEGYHSALVDARWNRDVFDAIMGDGR